VTYRIKNLVTPADLADLQKLPKQNKFRNEITESDGLRFDSKGEAERWSDLTILQAIGRISGLQRQVAYRLEVNEILICTYKADFVYVQDGVLVVEDFKGGKGTPAYLLKKKLMFALHGIVILETRKG